MSDCRQLLKGSDVSQGQTRRKYRTTFSSDQLEKLERAFQTNISLTDDDQLAQLSNETELTDARIKVWFQNRRNKLRKQERSSYCGLQKQQLRQNVDKTEAVVPKTAVGIEQNSQQNVCAVRGRAKCSRLFWRAVTFPMNTVAKLVKKLAVQRRLDGHFSVFDHAQLGLKLALLFPRFYALVHNHFDGKSELALWRQIKICKCAIAAMPKLAVFNDNDNLVPFPLSDRPLPNKIRFKRLEILYSDLFVIYFLRYNKQMLDKGTNLSYGSLQNKLVLPSRFWM
ncbi:hypothetical protein niasHT_000491 [Heterodera trifolii]|uniref:Homeobox protein prophet of Pit-1 n=1 Tax=Heterodera trifolii TaxID=157864 RepID=A0ABD2LU09_9BILA